MLHKFSSHKHAHYRRHHKSAGPSAGIAQAVQASYICVKVGVHFNFVAVDLQLRRLQQLFVGSNARHNLIHCLNEVHTAGHRTIWHSSGDVARDSVHKSGAHIRLA